VFSQATVVFAGSSASSGSAPANLDEVFEILHRNPMAVQPPPGCVIYEVASTLVNRYGQRIMGQANEYNSSRFVYSMFREVGIADVYHARPIMPGFRHAGVFRFSDGYADILGSVQSTGSVPTPPANPFNITGVPLVAVGTHSNLQVPPGVTGDIVAAILFDNAAVNVGGINTAVANLNADPNINVVGVMAARTGTRGQVRTAPGILNTSPAAIGLPLYFFEKALDRADYFTGMHHEAGNITCTVYAVLPAATDTPDLVIVSIAHIDTVMASSGAGDNAAGVASVVENARRFSNVDRGNIKMIFASVGAEEGSGMGMRGAGWLAEEFWSADEFASRGLTPGADWTGRFQDYKDVVIVFNNDMGAAPPWVTTDAARGYSLIDTISIHPFVPGHPRSGAASHGDEGILNLPSWLKLAHSDQVVKATGVDQYRLHNFGSTDHIQFANRGMLDVSSTALVNGTHHWVEQEYHTAEDTMEINYYFPRNLNTANMMGLGIAKAVYLETSKRANFGTRTGDSDIEVSLLEAERLFRTYQLGVRATFTNTDTNEDFERVFTPENLAFSLPLGSYEVSDVLGLGSGIIDSVTRVVHTFSTALVSSIAEIHIVTFDRNDPNPGVHATRTSIYGTALGTDMPTNPTRGGHMFTGWNTARDGSGTAFTSAIPVTGDITVYAQWRVTPPGSGYGWNPPTTAITPQQPPLADYDTPAVGLFTDVAVTDWFYAAVRAVWENQLFQGTSSTMFTPHGSMTRAMFVQVLANLEGVNLTAYEADSPTFADTSQAAWYFSAVEWAAGQGLVQGVGNDNFAPNAPVTREQMAVMLNNYVVSRNIELPQAVTNPFTDQDNISAWAMEGVSAIQAAGLIVGRSDGRFAPRDTATRAEVATIFARFLETADLSETEQ
ncbi:MAG: S-layer homology domain-containing protein, partial [Oscillospiraceae bacterium]|nr:S-layer homology domain-containing protein [Oscillospiraceae bacterium]